MSPEPGGTWHTPPTRWKCGVCKHPAREEINLALSGRFERMPDRNTIERMYQLDHADVQRHIDMHLRPTMIGSK
jgi:hypothetical protein